MQSWEEKQRQKNYNKKINNAKAVVKTKPLKKVVKEQSFDLNISKGQVRSVDSSQSQRKQQISDYFEHERKDLSQIPLYRVLRLFNLQQYAKELISRGYGYDIKQFNYLSDKQIDTLLLEIKTLPGHRTKLMALFEYINDLFPTFEDIPQPTPKSFISSKVQDASPFGVSKKSNSVKQLPYGKQYQKSTPKSQPQKQMIQQQNQKKNQTVSQVTRQNPHQVQKQTFTKIGQDYFRDSDDEQEEFTNEIEEILNKYQTQSNFFEKNSTIKIDQEKRLLEKINIAEQKIKARTHSEKQFISQFHQQDDEIQPVNPIKNVSNNHDYVKAQNIKQNQPIQILNNKNKKFLTQIGRFLNNDANSNQINLQMDKIKNLYISFDSGKMTSTLINLDIEEMCFCLGCAILKHIEHGVQIQKQSQYQMDDNEDQKTDTLNEDKDEQWFDDSRQINTYQEQNIKIYNDDQELEESDEMQDEYSKELQKLMQKAEMDQQQLLNQKNKSLAVISERTYDQSTLVKITDSNDNNIDFEESRQELENILRESLVQMKNQRKQISHEDDCYVHMEESYEKEDQDYSYEEDIVEDNGDSKFDTDRSHIKLMDQSLENQQYDKNDRYGQMQKEEQQNLINPLTLFKKAFNENSKDTWFQQMPLREFVSNFCKNIIITSKMEKEVIIIALIYIEKLILATQFPLMPSNWRKVTFTCLVLASKIWDDESFENDNFSKAFPIYKTMDINEMERILLQFIDYKLYISSSDYAKYYYILRTFAQKNKRSFPLRPLDLNTIINLQKKSFKQEKVLKTQYLSTVNKSF